MIGKNKRLISMVISLLLVSGSLTVPRVTVKAAENIEKPYFTANESKYGPFNGSESGKRAYEPFNSKEEDMFENGEYVEDRLLIKMKETKPVLGIFRAPKVELKHDSIEKFEALNVKGKASNNEGAKGLFKSSGIQTEEKWYKVDLKKGSDLRKVAKDLENNSEVVAVQPDYTRKIKGYAVPTSTTDPNMTDQWYLDALDIKKAWTYLNASGINPGGKRDIVVAVIDTGVDYNHPDLVGNIWTNTAEIAGNNADDDGNGFVDDIHGITTVGDRWNGESSDPMDDNGHGTHVAGIIASQANNNVGGTGIAYNVQIMPIKAAQSSGVLTSSDIAQAILYAADKGADVINMSFGGYGRNNIEEDALATAFSTSVLVASAGNDGMNNEPAFLGAPMYPAAYPWVIGVMAEGQQAKPNGDWLADFSNWDRLKENSYEYEVMAPGVDIYSTLPNGQYAKWDGTSMAAPVVSAIAAMVRSKYSDKSVYSSRFIMGQIASTGIEKQGKTYSPMYPPITYKEVNAYNALTLTPKPKLSYLEHYIFDKDSVASGNDGDGVVDAGETIDIGMVIRNHWGKADDVTVKLDTNSSAGLADPYVTLINDTVNYGAIGNFGTDDNGFIYENDVITGVNSPFKLKVAANTPNDHLVKINITMTAKNGFDSSDTSVYSFKKSISFIVRNGVELPGTISTDMTLTKDKYWIIPNATVIEKGAKVTVEPGTQIQFWSSQPEDPYAEKPMAYLQVRGEFIANGTAEEPIEMFASGMYPGYEVKIFSTENLGSGNFKGYAELNYTKIMNPNISVNKVDHSYFSQDLVSSMYKRYLSDGRVETYTDGPYVSAVNITNSKFYKLGLNTWSALRIDGNISNNLFDSCVYYFDERVAENNVFLKNYKLEGGMYGYRNYLTSVGKYFGNIINKDYALTVSNPEKFNNNGSTYFVVTPNIGLSGKNLMDKVQKFAESVGGHIATINDEEENNFLTSYSQRTSSDLTIGLNDFETEGSFKWANGETIAYTNWADGEPDNKYYSNNGDADFVVINSDGKWRDVNYASYFVIEVPGISHVTGITLDKTTLTLGAGGGTAKLIPTIYPPKATDKSVKWSSSDPTIASVDENGEVTPLKVGTVTITAETVDGGYKAYSEVTVRTIVPASGIKLNKSSLTLAKGKEEKLLAEVLPIEATNKNILWSSSDTTVAAVDELGNVKGLKEGTAVITAKSQDGNFEVNCTVQVVVPVSGVTIEPGYLRMVKGGEPAQLTANVQPSDATIKEVAWNTSDDSIATVDNTGKVTPIKEGTVLITATTSEGNFTGSAIVTVWENEIEFNPVKISSNGRKSLLLNSDGTVWAWGENYRTTPVQIKELFNVVDIAQDSGYSNNALALDGSGYVWRLNSMGSTPYKIPDLSGVKKIASGYNHYLALKEDGTVWAWGYNYYGQLGDGTNSDRYEPVQVEGLTDIISIAAGEYHSLALKNDGSVYTWGYNGYGQLGDGSSNNRNTPYKVEGISKVKSISAGYYNNLLVTENSELLVMGYVGYVGNYNKAIIQGLSGVAAVSGGRYHLTILKNDGTVWSIGNNNYGELGVTNISGTSSPLQIEKLSGITSISSGEYFSTAIKSDGTVWSWGNNEYGQLGNMTKVSSNEPVQVLTGILSDDVPPQVLSTSPTDNSVSVPLDSSININFSEAVRPGVNYSLIKLRDGSGNTISLKKKTIVGKTLTLEAVSAFNAGTTYEIIIPTSAVNDMFDNPYNQEYRFRFTTVSGYSAFLQKFSYTAKRVNSVPYISRSTTAVLPEIIITQEVLEKARLDFINGPELSTIKNNAILNRWWDPDVNHWMRFTANDGDSSKMYLANNYWGTTSELLIEKAIIHNNDFKTLADVVYKPILTEAPESTYPFVTDLYVSTESEARATKVGAEKIKVNVVFNRDMNTSVQPNVTFGPDMPTTDYRVNSVDGGWQDARRWVGEFNITPVTGDGYQFFRVVGAQAADDPWLVIGDDSERFRFEIITSGTEAMNLQAEGQGGKIHLSWTQDDFNTLAGYNLYRSNTLDGEYQKINSAVVPSQVKTYDDANVEPGMTYYYKFKVVKTDLTESDFSNAASAAAVDSVPPVISHTPPANGAVGLPLQVYAEVTDNVKVSKVTLFYRKIGTTNYSSKEMVKTTDVRYSASIEGSFIAVPGIEYYIEATDGITTSRNGSAASPNKVNVVDAPKIISISPSEGPDVGGTKVIITGSNFKSGATVTFDGISAKDVVVESSNKLVVTTPAHIPASVDVMVKNTNGFSDTVLRGFSYKKQGVDVSVLNSSTGKGTTFEVPVNTSYISGLLSAEFKLNFDPEVLSVKEVRTGNLTSLFTAAYNKNTSGQVYVTLAGAQSMNGFGTLAYVKFEVLNTTKTSSALTLSEVKLNGGNIINSTTDGNFTISANRSVSGYAYYYSNYIPVNNINLSLKGVKSYAGSSNQYGSFNVSDVISGDYKLTASKNDGINGISSYDASMVLQAVSGAITLNQYQTIAADVDCNGIVNAMDAAYILQYSSGKITLPFPGAGKVWSFSPQERSVNLQYWDSYGNDFAAILLGDVSGNWGSTSQPMVAAESKAEFNIGSVIKDVSGTYSMPVTVSMNKASLYGADMIVKYDANAATVSSVSKGEASKDFGVTFDTSIPGEIKISAAGAVPYASSGMFADIKFNVTDEKKLAATAVVKEAVVNENTVSAVLYLSKDVNEDKTVDILDIASAARDYNKKVSGALWNDKLDINRDGVIDLYDIVLISKGF